MRKTNPSISDKEVSKIVSEVDLDGDGTINFDGKRIEAALQGSSRTSLAGWMHVCMAMDGSSNPS